MADFAEQELVRRKVLTAGDVFGLFAGTTNFPERQILCG
jgi:hypothetical protein